MEQFKDVIFGSAMILVLIAALFLYIRAIMDIHKRKFASYREKAMWLTIIVLAPLLGSIFYFSMKQQPASNHQFRV